MGIPLNIDWQQIVLHLLNFAILAGGLYLLLYKPVKQFMEKRAAYFEKMDSDAKAHLAEAEAKEAEYRQKLDAADDEIERRRVEAGKAAEASARSIEDQAHAEASKVIEDAKKTAMQERERMLESANREIVEMAVEATKKILTDDAYEQFLDAAERGAEDAE